MAGFWRGKFKVLADPDSNSLLVVYIGKNPKIDLKKLDTL
jgi:hypothetical protein